MDEEGEMNNPYGPYNYNSYNNFPPNYIPERMGRPAALVWAFVLGMFSAIPEFIVGVLIATGAIAGFSLFGLSGLGAAISVIVIIISSIDLILWIFTFRGSNGARITLLVFLWLSLIPHLFSLVFTIPAIFELIECILLMSGSVTEYCRYRAFLSSQKRNQRIQQNYQANIQPNQGYMPPQQYQQYIPQQGYNPNNPTRPQYMPPPSYGGAGSNAVLIAEKGPLTGRQFLLSPMNQYIIGRAGDIQIPQYEKKTSRRHARITFENGRYVLTDLNSTNHTYVNGKMVTRAVLTNGDAIRIGESLFRFKG